MLRLGSVALEECPRVALALRDGARAEAVQAALNEGVDILEFRIDLFANQDPAAVQAELARWEGTPRIATVRMAAEGGGWRGNEADRLALYRAVLAHAEAVDVELAADAILDDVVAAAHDQGRLVLGSHHDFRETPPPDRLAAIADKGRDHGADIIKVAAHCQNTGDVQTLARFLLNTAYEDLVVIGMGAAGLCTRIFFPMLGSRITYTFLGEATAPGQLTCEATLRYLEAFQKGEADSNAGCDSADSV